MSGFLGRLTARHAESATPAISPRAVSRFETSPLPVERAVAAPTRPESRSAAPGIRETPATPAERHVSPVEDQRRERSLHEPAVSATITEHVVPVRTRIEQILKSVETIVPTPAVVATPQASPRAQQIVATPVVPRTAHEPAPRQATHNRLAVNQPTTEDSDPTVIRVHIGRIDVRASATPADRPRPRSKAADAENPMSLDRYLSGKDRS
jgi:hypothetical protein